MKIYSFDDMDNNLHFSSSKQDWETPQDLFNELNKEFNFEIDVAATRENSKCKMFFTENDNALVKNWSDYGNVFCNPPYDSKLQNEFIKKAYEESLKNKVVIVLLIPARTDTKRWHKYIFPYASDIRFLEGRLKFETQGIPHENSAPFPSAIVVFGVSR